MVTDVSRVAVGCAMLVWFLTLAGPVRAANGSGDMIMFADRAACPYHWDAAADSHSRLLVGTNGLFLGRKLGPDGGPLLEHSHRGSYQASFPPSGWIRATDPHPDTIKMTLFGGRWVIHDKLLVGSGGTQPLLQTQSDGLPYIQYTVCKLAADRKVPKDQPGPIVPTDSTLPEALPKWSIVFFNAKTCPAGWTFKQELYLKTIVPLPDNGTLGAAVNSGPHRHTAPTEHVPQAQLVNPGELKDGEQARSGERMQRGINISGMVDFSASVSDPDPVQLVPTIYYLPCQKTSGSDIGKPRNLPIGVLNFFAAKTCPTQWQAADAARGRFVLGKPESGQNGATFGGKPLEDREIRMHQHTIAARQQAVYANVDVFEGVFGRGIPNVGAVVRPGPFVLPDSNQMSDLASDAPAYVQFSLCRLMPPR
jgi:hypothetical protein